LEHRLAGGQRGERGGPGVEHRLEALKRGVVCDVQREQQRLQRVRHHRRSGRGGERHDVGGAEELDATLRSAAGPAALAGVSTARLGGGQLAGAQRLPLPLVEAGGGLFRVGEHLRC
jgi:hypothetical protein